MDTIHVTRSDEGEHWLVVTDVTTVKASGRAITGKLLVFEVTVPPGGGPRFTAVHSPAVMEDFMREIGR